MCNLCDVTKNDPKYNEFLTKMLESDKARMQRSKELIPDMKLMSRMAYSSLKWPVKLVKPMFEPRTAFAVPNNYYQNILLDEERLGVSFAHGAMRSLFFVGNKLVVFSKNVHFGDAKEFFTSFLLLHLTPKDYTVKIQGNDITISAEVEKSLRNLVTGKMEKKKIRFAFRNMPILNRIVSRDQALASAQFRRVYKKFGGARAKAASIDMEGYAITVQHFSPHPYMLQLHKEFGYGSNRDFQEHVVDYFKEHLSN